MFNRLRKLLGGGEKKELSVNMLATGRVFGSPLNASLSTGAISMNSVIGACMQPLTDAVTNAPLIAEKELANGWEMVPHDAIKIITNPQTGIVGYEQSFARLMWGVTWSDRTDGNVYLMIVRAASGKAMGVQYIPHTCVAVDMAANGGVLGYRVSRASQTLVVPVEDMIHVTYGIDPSNPVLGLSPLKAAMREVLTDNEITSFTHSIMKAPFPSVFVSFDGDGPALDDEQFKQFESKLHSMFTGEGRGRMMFTEEQLNVTPSGFKPNEMALSDLSDRPEERICAVLGVPPIVAGMGAGLARATFANYEEAKRAFYDTTVAGLWNRFSSALNEQYLRKAGFESEKIRLRFDTSGIKALSESEDALAKRATELFRGNVMNRGEARQMIGLDASAEDMTTWSYQLGPGALMLNGAKTRADAEANV